MKKSGGFTIVELLIVIVVIAILAVITIVAYNGIQARAENTKTIQGAAQYVKAFHSYAALYGSYPIDATFPCLGPLGSLCGRISGDGVGCTVSGDGPAAAQAGFDTEMKKIFSGPLPSLSTQALTCSGTSSTYGGAYYAPSTGNAASIRYYLKGDQPCGGIAGIASFSKVQQGDITRCAAFLPSL